ncbi:MAG: Fic family protein [Polyangiaceae bacterium]|nr:Fic family protein [Polyangiaceae bacterium]
MHLALYSRRVARAVAPWNMDFADRTAAVLAFPWEVLSYQEWLAANVRAATPGSDYLFGEAKRRLAPADADVLVSAEDLAVCDGRDGTHLVSSRLGADLPLADVESGGARAVLAAMDGERPLAALRETAGVAPSALAKVLEVGFGLVIFAPAAVAALDAEVPGVEIVRHPGSPYEIDRAYWRNMGDVRRALADARETLADVELAETDPARALGVFRRAHVLALMGRDLDSFYRPASPIALRGAAPGALLRSAPELVETPGGTRFVAGPRVHASFVGGEAYHRALYTVLGDPEAAQPRCHVDDGLDWGRVVIARAEQDAQAGPWFCPPRPLSVAHFAAVFGALAAAEQAADAGDRATAVRELAAFHQRFVRLHPFRCANQCLAMSAVNQVLRRSHGAGMPHLVLDHFALRVTPAAYRKLFANAVACYVVTGRSSASRFAELAERKRRAFACINRIATAGSLGGALAIVAEDLNVARLALFAS